MAQGSLNVQMSVSAVERLRYKDSYIASFKGSFVFLQGLYQLLEPSLVIRTRRADVANVKVGLTVGKIWLRLQYMLYMQAVLQEARKAYKDGTHKDVVLVVDEQEFLPSEG